MRAEGEIIFYCFRFGHARWLSRLFVRGWQMKTYDRTDDIIAALIFLGVGVLTVYAALNFM